ncbi:PepSY domain-containing protein [Hoeflea sp. CAU 1731]
MRFFLAVSLLVATTTTALADRPPNTEERKAIEDVLTTAGYTSWEEIEFDDDDDDRVWEVDDAIGPDGKEYDLKLDTDYKIIKKELD